MFLLYGPYNGFRDWLITTAMATMRHQYLAKWFYSDKTINKVLNQHKVIESDDDTNTDLIHIQDYDDDHDIIYESKYEEQILKRDPGNDLYKVIKIEAANKYVGGNLVVIYDPSKLKVASTSQLGITGELITRIAINNKAKVAINGGGFIDPDWNSNGGVPHGIVIENGKITANNEKANVGGGIVGMTWDNKLVLGKWTASEALNKGVRDAVEFGPFLIVNGKPSFIKGNGGWGTAPRTAIGQRQDGIILLLVMEGRQSTLQTDGADMVDLTEIMMRYKAYNAANMDGGSSSGLFVDGKIINKPTATSKSGLRYIPNAWIVTE